MAHFYGELQGQKGAVSRLGGKSGGIHTVAAGWHGAIRTDVFHNDETGEDRYEVWMTPWKGSGGDTRMIASGTLDANKEA